MNANLTDREAQVAVLVAQGLTNKEVARELGISPSTVKNHVHAVLRKHRLPRRGAIGAWLAEMAE